VGVAARLLPEADSSAGGEDADGSLEPTTCFWSRVEAGLTVFPWGTLVPDEGAAVASAWAVGGDDDDSPSFVDAMVGVCRKADLIRVFFLEQN